MIDIHFRVEGRAGRITLNRPAALNALTYEMALGIEGAIDEWRSADIDHHFAGATLGDIESSLQSDASEFAIETLEVLSQRAPLAMACRMEIIRRLRGVDSIQPALEQEFRFTHRAVAQGDFIEGIRAAIIDKDRSPKWVHRAIGDLTNADVDEMLAPLGADALTWEEMT